MHKCIAGIALYNPNLKLLKQNVEALIPQVDEVLLINNNSENTESICKAFTESKITMINYKDNGGTSRAFNTLFNYADIHGYEWCLTMDQDTICDNELIAKSQQFMSDSSISLISPRIIYNTDELRINYDNNARKINYAIASGSLVRVKTAISIQAYDENIFLDYADFEFCIRLRKSGGNIIYNPNTYIIHNLGELIIKSIGKKKIYVTNHNVNRRYLYAKNLEYVQRKHPDVITNWYVIKRILLKSLVVILFEDNKYKKVAAFIRGYFDGKRR